MKFDEICWDNRSLKITAVSSGSVRNRNMGEFDRIKERVFSIQVSSLATMSCVCFMEMMNVSLF